MPPKTRASAISATAAEKLGNARVPGLTSEVTVNDVSLPNAAASRNAAAAGVEQDPPDASAGIPKRVTTTRPFGNCAACWQCTRTMPLPIGSWGSR